MGKIKGARHDYYYMKWFWEGVALSRLLTLEENKGKSFGQVASENNIKTSSTTVKKKFDVEIDEDYKRIITAIDVSRVVKSELGGIRHYTLVNKDLLEIGFELLEEFDPDYISKNINTLLMKKRGVKMMENKMVEVKESNGVYNVVADMGNFCIKALSETGKAVFTSKIYEGYMDLEDKLNYIELDGRKIFIGTSKGVYNNEYDKVKKSNIAQMLYAISEVLPKDVDVADINLGYMLPINQMKNSSKIREKIEGQEFAFSTKHGDYIYTIKQVTFLPEGFASVGKILEEDETLLEGRTLILDCGSRTCNAIDLLDTEMQDSATIAYGSFDLYELIRVALEKNGQFKKTEMIQDLINRKKITVDKEIYEQFIKSLLNQIKDFTEDLDIFDNVVLLGGVAEIIKSKQYLCDMMPEGITYIMKNPVEANIEGGLIMIKEV